MLKTRENNLFGTKAGNRKCAPFLAKIDAEPIVTSTP